ncbi:MAG TPA: hypothetical protein VH855_05005, partial [Acetobacteraceae bacterium]
SMLIAPRGRGDARGGRRALWMIVRIKHKGRFLLSLRRKWQADPRRSWQEFRAEIRERSALFLALEKLPSR